MPEVQYPAQLNVGTVLLDDVIDRGGADRPCILAPDGTRWTYGELREHANRIAHVFVDDLGLVPGNRVLLRGPNNPWLVAIWIAALKAGAVIVPTMPMLRSKELRTICEIGNFNLAVCDHRFTKDLLNSQIPGLRTLTYGGSERRGEREDTSEGRARPAAPRSATEDTERRGEREDTSEGLEDILAMAQDKPATFEDVATAADDVSMLAFTSGTTGRPKATMHFHRDILANADTFSRYVLKPQPADVFIGTPPIAFTFGLGGLVIFPLRVGASTIMVEKATPEQLVDLIQELGATVCFTAPTAYKAMLAKGRAPALTGLRRAVSAGEHLPRATWEEFHEATGLKLIDGIGSTEMLHIFIGSSDDEIRPGSTGRPVPGYQAKIVDKAGRDAPDGVAGRLAVKGPTGCRYLADERQSVYVQDGWNITGDTFIRDEDGYFWYQARSDDMIISSGYNISGTEVEEALISHPEVMECAVVAAPDEERGYVVKAYVVPRGGLGQLGGEDGEATLRKALQDHVKGIIAPYKYPRKIEFLDALPRTSTGKVQRFVLRTEAAAATGSPSPGAVPS
ncbi:AMP-binding protein [Ornithinimicrobium pratense]|uniref:AMP-binding protein n=1 Tax=Ornithinimicrobium pratense TaxID=2593973 RepID=UPI001EE1A715|nr:AMP-binding protein [Ornithinimicrobium pratense]